MTHVREPDAKLLQAGSGRTPILVVESHSGMAVRGERTIFDGMRGAVEVQARSGGGPLMPG